MLDARDASAVNLVGGASFDYRAAMLRGIAFANDGACCQLALSQMFFCMNLPRAMIHICAHLSCEPTSLIALRRLGQPLAACQ
jgi:hypothetical protein